MCQVIVKLHVTLRKKSFQLLLKFKRENAVYESMLLTAVYTLSKQVGSAC